MSALVGGSSRLLPSWLRDVLPPESTDPDPVVYARFSVPDGGWDYHVASGRPVGDDYAFYGFVRNGRNTDDWHWKHYHCSELERRTGITLDETLQWGRLTDIVEIWDE